MEWLWRGRGRQILAGPDQPDSIHVLPLPLAMQARFEERLDSVADHCRRLSTRGHDGKALWSLGDDEIAKQMLFGDDHARRDLCDAVAARRLGDGSKSGNPYGGGRILCFQPSMTLSEGDAVEPTNGLLNEDACPGPGTWIWYLPASKRNYDVLLAWIPEHFAAGVDQAVETNTTACIWWADRRILNAVGLLA